MNREQLAKIIMPVHMLFCPSVSKICGKRGKKKREKMVIKDVEQLPDMRKFRQSWTFYPEKEIIKEE